MLHTQALLHPFKVSQTVWRFAKNFRILNRVKLCLHLRLEFDSAILQFAMNLSKEIREGSQMLTLFGQADAHVSCELVGIIATQSHFMINLDRLFSMDLANK